MAYTVPRNFQTRLSDDEPTDLTASVVGAAGTSDQLSRDDHRHGLPVGYIFVDNETPAGLINSTDGSDGNGTYTLANTPNPAGSLQLFVTSTLMVSAVHFTLAVATITFIAPFNPLTGESLRAWYRY